MSQDQTYCLNHLIARKLETQISRDKTLLFFHIIFTSMPKLILVLPWG